MTTPTPIERLEFQTQRLMETYPPVWRHPHKRLAYDLACPPGSVYEGRIVYSRWPELPLPASTCPKTALAKVECREGVYDYLPVAGRAATEWHVNFADPHLFIAYGSSLLAQDEMQVLEHPTLGALREALDAGGHAAVTVDNGRPTPVLVRGVERRCRVATDRNPDEGRPDGLYGNAFARASEETVRRAVRRIDPPTLTNLVAMAAPRPGWGQYRREQIHEALSAAYTGFRAACLEAGAAPVTIHTGFWGCGAFGGNRQLMAAVQILAAEMAGVERLVFHTVSATGTTAFGQALQLIENELGPGEIATDRLEDRFVAMQFEWGVSDGN